ncbi:MAG: molybdate ABC transporter permease subunit [Kangiellaceae bacterium]|nr:molybdate ABC transporter permease subunit [Kangiellaceae bacterium]
MSDLSAILITLKLALVTTSILMLVCVPLAWWLARPQQSKWSQNIRSLVEAIVALPLVLPPTVLGFYLLLAFSPDSWLGEGWIQLTGSSLAFSFSGLVIGSLIYSLPFVVQPLQATFAAIPLSTLEVSRSMGTSNWAQFSRVIFPMSKTGFIGAFSLGFAHTLGEFGVVLMIGGNISDQTRVLSIAIYDHVETLQFEQAHQLSIGLVIFSLILLTLLYRTKNNRVGFH